MGPRLLTRKRGKPQDRPAAQRLLGIGVKKKNQHCRGRRKAPKGGFRSWDVFGSEKHKRRQRRDKKNVPAKKKKTEGKNVALGLLGHRKKKKGCLAKLLTDHADVPGGARGEKNIRGRASEGSDQT